MTRHIIWLIYDLINDAILSVSNPLKWSKEKLGLAKPSTFDADFLVIEKSYRALEKLLDDLVKFIVVYLQPKAKWVFC